MLRGLALYLLICIAIPAGLGAADDVYLFQRGVSCWEKGRFDTAVMYFKSYKKRNSANRSEIAKSLLWIGKCFYYKWDIDQAVQSFREIVTTYPETEVAADAAKWSGDAYFQSKQFTAAEKEYQVFLRLFPNNALAPIVVFQIGESLYRLARLQAALGYYQMVLAQYPKHVIARQAIHKMDLIKRSLK